MNTDQSIQIYCDIDTEGNIVTSLIGRYVIPSRNYDVFLLTDDERAISNPDKIKIVFDYENEGKPVPKATLVFEEES